VGLDGFVSYIRSFAAHTFHRSQKLGGNNHTKKHLSYNDTQDEEVTVFRKSPGQQHTAPRKEA